MSQLNLPMCNFEPFPHTSFHWISRKRDKHIPFHILSSGICRDQQSCPSASFSPNYTSPKVFSLSLKHSLPSPFTNVVTLLWRNSRTIVSFLNCRAKKFTQFSKRSHINTKQSRIIISFDQLFVLCSLLPKLQFALLASRPTDDSHRACCQSASPDPLLPDCSPATSLPVYNLYRGKIILHAESSILTC